MKKDYDVIGIGASTLDLINVVESYSTVEDVQRTIMFRFDFGGPVSTAIVTLSRLGMRTAMLDSIGDDFAGKAILSEYKKEKVDISNIRISQSCLSSVSTILVKESDGSRIIYYTPSNAPELKAEDINTGILKKSRMLHTNGRHIDAAVFAADYSRRNGITVSFDGGAGRYRPELIPLIRLSEIFIAARNFAEVFSGETDIAKSAEFILQEGPRLVIITEGITGSWLFTDTINGYHQKAFSPGKVIDTTGCGDCYHGAFLYSYLKEEDLYKSIEFASAAAAINATTPGARTALPAECDVLEFINQNR